MVVNQLVHVFLYVKMANHISYNAVEMYLRESSYPSEISADKGKRANFRKGCKPFCIRNGQLMYKETRLVISSKERQQIIIKDVHAGLGTRVRE